MPAKKELKNKRFARLLVLCENGRDKHGQILWKCKCDCGKIITVRARALTTKHTKSCGCLFTETFTTHGLTKHPIYSVWRNMIQRCYNIKNKRYNDWGGRGIIVCPEWKYSTTEFINWAIHKGYKKELRIDRINNDGNYTPSNCRFVNPSISAQNQRVRKTSKTQLKYIYPQKEKYVVNIPTRLTTKTKDYIGIYATLEEAIKIRNENLVSLKIGGFYGEPRNKRRDVETLMEKVVSNCITHKKKHLTKEEEKNTKPIKGLPRLRQNKENYHEFQKSHES